MSRDKSVILYRRETQAWAHTICINDWFTSDYVWLSTTLYLWHVDNLSNSIRIKRYKISLYRRFNRLNGFKVRNISRYKNGCKRKYYWRWMLFGLFDVDGMPIWSYNDERFVQFLAFTVLLRALHTCQWLIVARVWPLSLREFQRFLWF